MTLSPTLSLALTLTPSLIPRSALGAAQRPTRESIYAQYGWVYQPCLKALSPLLAFAAAQLLEDACTVSLLHQQTARANAELAQRVRRLQREAKDLKHSNAAYRKELVHFEADEKAMMADLNAHAVALASAGAVPAKPERDDERIALYEQELTEAADLTMRQNALIESMKLYADELVADRDAGHAALTQHREAIQRGRGVLANRCLSFLELWMGHLELSSASAPIDAGQADFDNSGLQRALAALREQLIRDGGLDDFEEIVGVVCEVMTLAVTVVTAMSFDKGDGAFPSPRASIAFPSPRASVSSEALFPEDISESTPFRNNSVDLGEQRPADTSVTHRDSLPTEQPKPKGVKGSGGLLNESFGTEESLVQNLSANGV
uniref:Uncharacterized protein n=1 Tax=Phaeomonas parva TaxID=124430 RepID=A0A7S1UGT9_9STRA